VIEWEIRERVESREMRLRESQEIECEIGRVEGDGALSSSGWHR
jgi:hypothetical protein